MLRLAVWVLVFLPLSLMARAAQAQQETPSASPTGNPPAMATPMLGTEKPELTIRAPISGQALQGSVAIEGKIAASGFVSSELAFAYAGDPTGTWFLIAEAAEPVQDGVIAQWDTSAITDGDYNLRLRVLLEDGSHAETVVPGLRVRNYTPIETDTPTPVTPTATLLPGDTPVVTATPRALPSASPLPANPAEVSSQDILLSMGKGALAIAGLFALMGVYALVKGLVDKGL